MTATTLQEHEVEMPDCTDPDCEFHRAPEGETYMGIIRDCDLCAMLGRVKTPATYDAKTKAGPWAYVCDEHLESHCFGQESELKTKLTDTRRMTAKAVRE